MTEDNCIRVPIYVVDVTDYLDGGKTYRTWTFDETDHMTIGDDRIEKSFAGGDRLGFVTAPPGSWMGDVDGETVLVLPRSRYGHTAQDVLEMARSGEYEGLTFTLSAAPAV